ncbi:MAG: DMT family transporter [Bacteroidetes bacterium]|nr:DMT family transporter [Bacteroidota bacterium]
MPNLKTSPPVSILAIGMTVLAPIVWSTGGVGIRLLDISSWDILFWRSLFMFISIIFWLIIRRKPNKTVKEYSKTLIQGLPVSIFTCMSLCFYVLSMKNTSAADSLLIQGTAPFFILILGRIYLKDHISKQTTFALVGIGIYTLIGGGIIILSLIFNSLQSEL